MFSRVEAMLTRIESLRQQMHEIANSYGIGSQQALAASQRLDAELNEYYRMQRNSKEKMAS